MQSAAKTRVRQIRTLYDAVTREAVKSDRKDPSARIFCDRWSENANEQSGAAVGIYRAQYAFYYGFKGEEEPYADRLTYLRAHIARSDRHLMAEYLWNGKGALLFCYQKQDIHDAFTEFRLYYGPNESPLHLANGLRDTDKLTAEEQRAARDTAAEAKRLRAFWEAKKNLLTGP